MIVKVDNVHINTGKPGDANSCAIALAMKDAGCMMVKVTHHSIYYGNEEIMEIVAVPIPDKVLEFVVNFDNGYRVYPFEFELGE